VKGQAGSRANALLEELVEVATRLGFEVRREKLLREVGYRARGGTCRLKERELIILDREQAPGEQIDVVIEALRRRDLEALYLSPAARRLLYAEQG
jgi:predicted phosphoribosyltransferase